MSKIVIIGAGSVVFSRRLISDIILEKELSGSTVALCDIDPEGLELTAGLARRMADEAGADITIESSTDRTQVLPGADYVIQTIAIGGKAAWEKDLNIPMKYGIVQPVGDSVGPGGLSRALRLLPVVVDICHDMEDLCPDALLLNYSNPNSCVCAAAHQYSSIKVIGLCHGLLGTQKQLADYLGVAVERTKVLAVGVNHFNWILKLLIDDQDVLAMLREKIDKEGIRKGMQISANLFRIFGAFPAPGDVHVAEFLPYFLNQESDRGEKYGLSLMKAYGQNPEHWEEIRRHLDEDVSVKHYLNPSEEQAIDIIAALQGKDDIIFDAINLPNYGIVSNLPEGAILEVPATVGVFGVRGVCVDDIPFSIAAMLSTRIFQQQLTVEAAMSGDRQLTLQAMLLDPLVPNIEIAEAMLNELMKAHSEHLPQFFE
jgi:alpha-galactosidase